jgi:branched-chain amino acid transport system permease protein
MSLPFEIPQGSALDRVFRIAGPLALLALVVGMPYLVPSFRLGQITAALILAIAVVALNLLSGFAGQISLGHAAFFGIGAYTTGVMQIHYGWSALPTIVLGMVLSFVVGVLVGLPALRLRGMYLALVTLAVGVLFPSLIRRFDDLTGGASGLFGIEVNPPEIAYFSGYAGRTVWMYYVSIVGLTLASLVVWNLMRSRVGRAVVALRDHETAAIVVGVNRAFVRTVVFGLSGALASMGGSLYALNVGILTPDSFSLLLTINLLVAMVLGGTASYWGPIFGAFIIYFVPIWTADAAQGPVAGALFGVVVIIMVFTLPTGLAGGGKKLLGKVVVRSRPVYPTTPVADGSADPDEQDQRLGEPAGV